MKNLFTDRIQGFDEYMGKILKDWNAPGIGVGIVQDDALVFANGYGYGYYVKKLPLTPHTLYQIASNTKLFTAVAAGMLVEEGKLSWDRPIRDCVPAIRFYNDQLNNNVTLRDMLAHRTGITRHDNIWYKSSLTRKEMFERIKYLEPRQPLRQMLLYNNLMYAAVGYLIELQSGKTWEEFVRERILKPLDMNATVYSVAEMIKQEDYPVLFTEKRDSTEIHKIPYYEDAGGLAPAGAVISNIQDMSHWLIALMNDGTYGGRQVIPSTVLKATLEPAFALPNAGVEARGWWELLNAAGCLGRICASYRGHLLTFHGGGIDGSYSQVSFMPRERIGVIVFVIGNHCACLSDVVGNNVYERVLGMDQTPWSERWLEIVRKAKQAGTEARARAGADRVPDTHPSHALKDFAAVYEHPAYGELKVTFDNDHLLFEFHKVQLPLSHFHYDRFDTPDDELKGKWTVNFITDPQGMVDRAVMSLDEAEVVFTRKPESPDSRILPNLAGTYQTPDGFPFQVALKEDGNLYFIVSGQPEDRMIPYTGLRFRIARFSDIVLEFLMENDQARALKIIGPWGEQVHTRK